ncbi:Aste57867_11173 [Aphanomyces stellatus]|uniref:Aste57867_11173 protein n=1 Tax=Aphanomyces stellatus TaxID=120398 RepID=A0A485KU42_9STRA|nr:hypothetical protein As57867_011131 [Aphanomyces stellatus]VFT88040.1 Aste57867_11173 [Aphanomyces stellatus]
MGAGASFDVFTPGELEAEMQEADASSPTSSWELFKAGYDSIVHTIIRPPRHEYTAAALGPIDLNMGSGQIHRTDFVVLNGRNQALQCSVWDTVAGCTSCVLYLHSISGSRVEALSLLGPLMQIGHAVAAVDFSGSGLSDGKYISMGLTEHQDVMAALKALHKYRGGQFNVVHLWGRCMGANAALLLLNNGPLLKSTLTVLVVESDKIVCSAKVRNVVLMRDQVRDAPLDSVEFVVDSLCGHESMVVSIARHPHNNVRAGDVLVQVNGQSVVGKPSAEVLGLLADAAAGGTVQLTLSGLRQATPSNKSNDDAAALFLGWLVLDSTFSDLETVLHDMVRAAQTDGWQIPSFLVSAGIALLRSSISHTAGFDLKDVAPCRGLANCVAPVVFLHGTQDFFVPSQHSQTNLKAYGGRHKAFVAFKGTHDSIRARDLVESVLVKATHMAGKHRAKDEAALRRQLFPSDEGTYPTWSTTVGSTWKVDSEGDVPQDSRIAPYSAYVTGHRDKAEGEAATHVEYTISVYCPPTLFVQMAPEAPNEFGEKDKDEAVREGSEAINMMDEPEVKSLWKTFVSAAGKSPAKVRRASSWITKRWGSRRDTARGGPPDDSVPTTLHGEAAGGGIESTFQVDRRFHDIKLLLTKLSALPGGLPTDLQAIRSKLVYSTKIGLARVEERKHLLNATLQIVCAAPALWGHHIVHQFLCLEPTRSNQ